MFESQQQSGSGPVVIDAVKMLRELEHEAREKVLSAFKSNDTELRFVAVRVVDNPALDQVKYVVKFSINGKERRIEVDECELAMLRVQAIDTFGRTSPLHDKLMGALAQDIVDVFHMAIAKAIVDDDAARQRRMLEQK